MVWFYDVTNRKKLQVYHAERKGSSIKLFHYDEDGDKTMKIVTSNHKNYTNAEKCLLAMKRRDRKSKNIFNKAFGIK